MLDIFIEHIEQNFIDEKIKHDSKQNLLIKNIRLHAWQLLLVKITQGYCSFDYSKKWELTNFSKTQIAQNTFIDLYIEWLKKLCGRQWVNRNLSDFVKVKKIASNYHIGNIFPFDPSQFTLANLTRKLALLDRNEEPSTNLQFFTLLENAKGILAVDYKLTNWSPEEFMEFYYPISRYCQINIEEYNQQKKLAIQFCKNIMKFLKPIDPNQFGGFDVVGFVRDQISSDDLEGIF